MNAETFPVIGVRPIPREHLDALLESAANDAVQRAEKRAAERLAAGDWRERELWKMRHGEPRKVRRPAPFLRASIAAFAVALVVALTALVW